VIAETLVVSPRFIQGELRIETAGACAFHDLTADVDRFLEGSGLGAGMVLLLSLHTTAGLLVNERETGFSLDFQEAADRLVPREHAYTHDDFSVRHENICPEDLEFPNGHAHLQHAVLAAPSLVLPVEAGRTVLGQWQRVFLIEFDRPRSRRVRLHAFGYAAAPAEGDGAVERRASPSGNHACS
jgi:secondary thiamine-phosphate synthase enzyme